MNPLLDTSPFSVSLFLFFYIFFFLLGVCVILTAQVIHFEILFKSNNKKRKKNEHAFRTTPQEALGIVANIEKFPGAIGPADRKR